MAKPSIIVAPSRRFSFLLTIRIATPTIARIGEKEDGFSNCKNRLCPVISVILKIHAVTVVPTFAPIITPTARDKLIIPELTKPTTITVVADED